MQASIKNTLLETAKVVGAAVVVGGFIWTVVLQPVIAQVVDDRVQSKVEKLQAELIALTTQQNASLTQQVLFNERQAAIKEAIAELLRWQDNQDESTQEILTLLRGMSE